MHPFSPRPIRFSSVLTKGPWSVKSYRVLFDGVPLDERAFQPALDRALDTLPEPSSAEGRPGLGFVIAHQGRTGDYVVLAWWDRENELPVRIWVRRSRDEPWREGREGESFCVWDLEILWFERQAWVETMLVQGSPSPEAYLARVLER